MRCTRIKSPFWIVLMAVLFPFSTVVSAIQTDRSAEERIINHLMKNVEPGKPFIFSHLYNNVFTSPEERKALDRLFSIFFQIPSFIAQHKAATDKIPTLADIQRQFNLRIPGEVQLLHTVMENDPRIPAFMERDEKSGEIVGVDINEIRKDKRFGEAIERSLVGWTGKKAPPFTLDLSGGGKISSAALLGRSYLIYFWFSGCPPCIRTSSNSDFCMEKPTMRSPFTVKSDIYIGYIILFGNLKSLPMGGVKGTG